MLSCNRDSCKKTNLKLVISLHGNNSLLTPICQKLPGNLLLTWVDKILPTHLDWLLLVYKPCKELRKLFIDTKFHCLDLEINIFESKHCKSCIFFFLVMWWVGEGERDHKYKYLNNESYSVNWFYPVTASWDDLHSWWILTSLQFKCCITSSFWIQISFFILMIKRNLAWTQMEATTRHHHYLRISTKNVNGH